ncbi:MAG: endonuclease VIII [Halioglobus sp.]
MPEGPEIRRAADALAAVLEEQPIHTVRFGQPRLRHFAKALRGHRVTRVETRGKALLTHFEHGLSIYSHNQLYGVWRVVKGHTLPASKRSLRLLLQTDTHSAILYSASDIGVWPTEELGEHPFLRKLGPDIMENGLSWRQIAERLTMDTFAKRDLSTLYLDQAFLAGNGNYLRSEILFDARLPPRKRAAELTRAETGRLARSTLAISRRSYATAGITLAPRLSNALQRQGLPRGQRRFYVFGREDLPCYACATPIRRVALGSRRLYYCPRCQAA